MTSDYPPGVLALVRAARGILDVTERTDHGGYCLACQAWPPVHHASCEIASIHAALAPFKDIPNGD